MKLTFKHTKLACYLGYIVSAMINNFTPLLFVIFQTVFKIKMWQLSRLIPLNCGTQMTVDFLGAKFADKVGYRKMAVTANILCVSGLIILGALTRIINPYTAILIATVTMAVSSGLLEVIVSPIIAAIPSDETSGSMSLLHSFYSWGQVLTVLVSTLFFVMFGKNNWNMLCFLWTVIPVISGALFLKVPINSYTDEKIKVPMRKLFKVKIFWVFLILMLCAGAAELGMAQWASLFAETALHVSKTVGDLFGPCSFAVAMGIGRVMYAKFSQKLNILNYIIFCSFLCTISYVMAALSPNSFLSLLGCTLCGFSVGVMWPGVLSMASVKCPEGGTALFGLLAFSGDIGCFAGPNFIAAVSEKVTVNGSALKGGILFCAIFPLVMIIFTYVLKSMKVGKIDE